MISEIALNGTPLDLATIEYQVQIQHGRSDVTTSPQPSNAQIIIRGSVGVSVEISDLLEIRAYGFRRFTGEVSDVTITHLSSVPPVAVSTITAIGELSRVGFTEVGASGWSEDTVSQRVDDVLTTVGLPYLNGADPDIVLHQISTGNAQPTDALSYLSQLAEWTGATFYDDPAGRIVFESYGNRGITSFAGVWSSQIGTWADNPVAWGSFPVDQSPTIIPSDGVIFTPQWSRTRQTIINSVTVLGYNDSHETTQTDSASIASYGLREYRLATEIKSSGDVTDRAGKIITAQANPLWSLGAISIQVHNLDTNDRDKVLELVSGMAVSLSGLPQPAPLANFLGIVEGWGEVYTPGEHILTLSLSDPRYSFETVTWGEVDPALEWGDVPAGLQWYEIITGSDLAA
jgi:hypothetical protein